MGTIREQEALLMVLSVICIAALAQSLVAQEVPSDYQQVMKMVGKQGDYKAKILRKSFRHQIHILLAAVRCI